MDEPHLPLLPLPPSSETSSSSQYWLRVIVGDGGRSSEPPLGFLRFWLLADFIKHFLGRFYAVFHVLP
jgi:hypothetical protein